MVTPSPGALAGTISNCCTFVIMALGMLLKATTAPGSGAREFSRWVLAAGLFGFAGGMRVRERVRRGVGVAWDAARGAETIRG